MQVAFYFAGEITQVLDGIPWVRCASGNVFFLMTPLNKNQKFCEMSGLSENGLQNANNRVT